MKQKIDKSYVVLLNKAKDITSFKAIANFKNKFSVSKLGHCGTLDPNATGLLIIVCNRATKLANYFVKQDKTYLAKIKFGFSTNTDDIWGETLETSTNLVNLESIEKELKNFIGIISQYPPKVSAVKVSGVRAYKLERENKEFKLNSRDITINKFEILNFDQTKQELECRIDCSSGTYIRSIARDLAENLGTLGCLSMLDRERIGIFKLSEAKDIESIQESDFKPWYQLLEDLPRVELTSSQCLSLKGGDQRFLSEISNKINQISGNYSQIFYTLNDVPLGILELINNNWILKISME